MVQETDSGPTHEQAAAEIGGPSALLLGQRQSEAVDGRSDRSVGEQSMFSE